MNKKDLKVLRHSAAHLAAHALKDLFPGIKLTIGPATEEGFFYDIQPRKNLKEEDLALIEKKMNEISQMDLPIEHREISKKEARELFKDNPFKLELIEEIPGDSVGLSVQGDFYDLCKGGHVESTGDIKHFKLTGLSGSYWRADRTKPALQRIHGIAFYSQKDLDDYLKRQEELQKYDHRRLGKQMDLFSFNEEAVGFPFFHPKGEIVLNILKKYMRKLYNQYNYKEISTPTLLSADLWKKSGHWDYYKDNMYFTLVDDRSYAIKPMNCPGSFLVYKHKPRSYRELPLRLAEFGRVHRHELSGVLHGLMRVRAFQIDDAHIYCTLDQIESEIRHLLEFAFKVLNKFGFNNFQIALSTRPKDAMGSHEVWGKATEALKKALDSFGYPYKIQEGEGAFYGPKIDISIQDSMGREWQCGTIQLDFFQPENFDLTYVAPSGRHERPVVIHRAIYGSLERFFAILLEHYKGNLPFWLSPEQIRILTITDEQKEYAQKIKEKFIQEGLRVSIDESSNPINGKIKTAQIEKVPWMFIIGKKEADTNTISLRHSDGKQEFNLNIDDLINRAKELNKL